MRRSEICIILVFVASVVLSTPLQPKGAPLLLRSQFVSQDEIERAVVRLENGDESEYGELMETEERSEDGDTTLTLTSPSKEMKLKLRPNYRLIKPFARLTIMDGDEERESFFDPSLRTSFYHGSVSGSPNGMASLVRSKDGWNGMIMTDSQRYVVHGIRGSSRALLLPMSTEDEEFYNGYSRLLEAEDREREYNRTGDESFSRVQEYNMTGDESISRSSDSEFELELAVYTDEDLYKFVKRKYPSENTKQKVQEIALIAVNTIHVLYQKPSIGNKINVVVAKMVVMTTNPAGLHKNNNMRTYLGNYCNWDAEKQNPWGTKYDLGLMLTGIGKLEDPGPAGMTHRYRTCLHDTKQSCAIGKGTTYGAGFIMAHEIGHNLGMEHDGYKNTCSKKGYIMGRYASAGAATWSTCSKDYLADYLESLDDFGLNCMRDKGTAAMEHSVEGKLPGERVKRDDQCRFAFGEGWTEYTKRQSFCAYTWCLKGTALKSPRQPPLPGTYCGSGKICWDGHCSDRNTVINKIQAYNPTKSWSTGKLDEVCRKQAPGYPEALTYNRLAAFFSVNDPHGVISSMCNRGMLCRRNNSFAMTRLRFKAPPGTSCAAGKVCKNFACVRSGGSIRSSRGSTSVNGGSRGSTSGNGGSRGSTSGNGGSRGSTGDQATQENLYL